MEKKSLVPTEHIPLPSKGWFYPENHPLSSGGVDLFYMTARHEDILSSTNLIMKGTVIDKLLEALIATDGVEYNDLLVGDRNAVMLAARIFGYGKMYDATIDCPQCQQNVEQSVNLEEIEWKELDLKPEQKGKNEFAFQLPLCRKTITFKLLTQRDDTNIRKELEGLRKLTGDLSREVTTRMRHAILSVDGSTDRQEILQFVDNMPARDAMAFRAYAREVMPNVDMRLPFECPKCGFADRLEVPIDHKFFWPNARV